MLSICNSCRQGALECEFMADLIPVEGWTAQKCYCDHGETYNVKKCPKYVPMRPANTRENTKKCCVCGKDFKKTFKTQVRCRECIDSNRLPEYTPLKKKRGRRNGNK